MRMARSHYVGDDGCMRMTGSQSHMRVIRTRVSWQGTMRMAVPYSPIRMTGIPYLIMRMIVTIGCQLTWDSMRMNTHRAHFVMRMKP